MMKRAGHNTLSGLFTLAEMPRKIMTCTVATRYAALAKLGEPLIATATDRAKPTPVKPQERREIGAEFTWQTVQHPISPIEDGVI
jgi:hypothetical protein